MPTLKFCMLHFYCECYHRHVKINFYYLTSLSITLMKKLYILALFAIATLNLPQLVFADDYTIDPDHSSISFKVRHLGISSVNGKLLKFSGDFSFDPANLSTSKTNATIDSASINTSNDKRDKHIKDTDFLNAPKFPKIEFKSKEIRDATQEGFKVVGDLTIHGVVKETVLNVIPTGVAKDPWGNERAGFNASAVINRKDFGITWNKTLDSGGLLVGEEIQVDLEIEGIKTPGERRAQLGISALHKIKPN